MSKYNTKQYDRINELLPHSAYNYVASYRNGDIVIEGEYKFSELKEIVKIIEEFDKENGVFI